VKEMRFLSGIRRAVGLPSFNHRILNKGRHIGRNILDVTGDYEGYVYERMSQYWDMSRYTLPRISVYSNGNFKTNIYKTSEPSPCLDEIFYKQENLVPYGKEYWFAIFTSMDSKKPMQLISCFGRRNSRKSVIDNVEIGTDNPSDGVLKTGAFAWCFDGKKKLVVPAVETLTTFTEQSIRSDGDELSIDISGTVPLYNVKINSGAIKCDFNLNKPSIGYDEEVLNELKMGLNYQVYNLYYNFDGTLNGKEYKGRCYLQKVILSTPLIPWHWGRLIFQDGSFFVFFKPYFGSPDLNYPLRNKGIFYSAQHDKLFWVYNIEVRHDSKRVNWKFTSRGEDYSLNVAVKAYANHGFNFRYGGAFNYNEHMVNVKKFDFRMGDVKINMKKLGTGAGIVEDATGLLI
jgi:hypothetical protein